MKKGTRNKKGAKEYTIAQRIKMLEQFRELYSTGDYTMESICKKIGFSMRVIYNWIENEAIAKRFDKDAPTPITKIFNEAKREAAFSYREGLILKSRSSLERLVTGETYNEVTNETTTGVFPSTKTKTVRKMILPNATAVMFALKTQDPENFVETNNLNLGLGENISNITFQVKQKGV